MDEVRDAPLKGPAIHRAPLGVPLDDLRKRLKPGKSVLLDECRGVPNVRSLYYSVRKSQWATHLVPGYVVVPSMSDMKKTGKSIWSGDLWLTLEKKEEN